MKSKIRMFVIYVLIIIAIRLVGSFLMRIFLNDIIAPTWVVMTIFLTKVLAQIFMVCLLVKKVFIDQTVEEVPIPADVPRPFNYKKFSNLIIIAGVVGIILSFIYYFNTINCDFLEHHCDDIEKSLNTAIINAQTIYYGGVAVFLLASGILLRFKKKIGLYIFSIIIILVVASFFLPSNLFLPQYDDPAISLVYSSLFVNSIKAALWGSILMFGLPILGVVVYFSIIIINLSFINKWAEFLDIIKNENYKNKFFKFLPYLFIVGFILAIIFLLFTKYEQYQSKQKWSDPTNYTEPVTLPGF